MNLSGLSSATTAATSLSNLILVTPDTDGFYQPNSSGGLQAQTPPKLLFNYDGEQTATLESDITDHYIEDNTAIQDQIALRPEVITTHGFIGELNDIRPAGLAFLNEIANRLGVINSYVPGLSSTALAASNTANQLYSVGANALNAGISAWSSLTGKNQTKQQIFFQQFYGYWKSRTLFTVQTPWAIFDSMAIKSLRAIQDADTKVITDFEVSFKKIRTANASGGASIVSLYTGRAGDQISPSSNLGSSSGTPDQSLSSGLSTAGLA